VALAKRIVSGELPPNEGCARIASIPGAIDIRELDKLTHLAHLQDGTHDRFGFTAESCIPGIIEECKALIAHRS
jgi:hypothetical protein